MSVLTLPVIEIVVLGLLSGIVGTLAVLRKRVFYTVALSHATFPGGVIAAMLGFSVLAGSAMFSVVLMLIMVGLGRLRQQGHQVASGVVLTFGFALGALLQSMNRSLSVPVEALLIGSLLSVRQEDIVAAGVVLIAAIAVLALFGRPLLFSTFDPDGFRAAGYRPWLTDLAALGIIAATVVVTMPAVGAILGVALIIGPAVTARVLVKNVYWMMPVAATVGVLGGLLGLAASGLFSIAAGGAVGMAVALLFALAVAVRSIRLGLTQRRARRGINQTQHVAA